MQLKPRITAPKSHSLHETCVIGVDLDYPYTDLGYDIPIATFTVGVGDALILVTTHQMTLAVKTAILHIVAMTLDGVFESHVRTLQKWLTAIEKAYDWLLQQESVTVDDEGMLRIPSASDDQAVYRTSSTLCECLAFIGDRPCCHRAARQRREEAVQAMMELYTL